MTTTLQVVPFDDGTGDQFDHGAGDDGHGGFDRYGPPPHPDDRLWRHPSELAAGARPPSPIAPAGRRRTSSTGRPAPGKRSRTRLAVLAVAAGGGGVVAAAALTLVGVRERIVERTVTERVAVTSGVTTSPMAAGSSPGGGDAAPGPVDPAVVLIEGTSGSGSGFLVRDDGTVLTSATVVGPASTGTVPVTLSDGRRLRASVRGADEVTDVAVISLPDGEYPTVVLATDSLAARGAELAVVARHPDGGIGRSQGLVASTAWSLRRDQLPPLDGLLQVSTAADPAAHGGPMVDDRDAVVGMTTRSYQSWSYAVPIDIATKVADDVLAGGRADHPWLGIEGAGVEGTSDMAAGVSLSAVAPDGPAGGILEPGDVIVGWDGTPIPDMTTLQSQLLRHRPGDVVEITFQRDGSTTPSRADVELGEPAT